MPPVRCECEYPGMPTVKRRRVLLSLGPGTLPSQGRDRLDRTSYNVRLSGRPPLTGREMIAALPEKLRQPLILSTIEEMSPGEVAATLGINEAAVRSRVFRARKILREKLAAGIARK